MKNFIFFNKNHEIYIPEGINKLLHRAVTKYNEAETIRALEENSVKIEWIVKQSIISTLTVKYVECNI